MNRLSQSSDPTVLDLLRMILLPAAVLIILSRQNILFAQTLEWIDQFEILGGSEALGVTADSTGVYIASYLAGSLPGQISSGARDAFIRKYDTTGNAIWTRQFGTVGNDTPYALAAYSSGIYVVGITDSAFPAQVNAGSFDAFIRKYDLNGNVIWTRQFGTTRPDFARAVAVDASGVYLGGFTDGTLPGQTSAGGSDAFVRKYDLNGTEVWTRQFGTEGFDDALGVTVDVTGVYVAGRTTGILAGQSGGRGNFSGFLRKYDAAGTEGWTRQFGTEAKGVVADSSGVYVAGYIAEPFPNLMSAGGHDAFLRKYHTAGLELWTRQFGTTEEDHAVAVTSNASGIFVAGYTVDAMLAGPPMGSFDIFVRKYDPSGTEQWTRQFGSDQQDLPEGIAADDSGVYVVGSTNGALPGQESDGSTAGFVAKFNEFLEPPAVFDGGVVNNASFAPSPAPVAPGSIAAVFGDNLNRGLVVLSSDFGPDGKLVTTLGGASATVNGIPAPMFYSTPGQLGIQIPFELAGQSTAEVRVIVGGAVSLSRTFFLDTYAPGIFTTSQDGRGTAVVLHQNGVTPVTTQAPARPGEVVVMFATGLGPLSPPLATGAGAAIHVTSTPATVLIDGIPAEVQFSGAAPGFAGLNQINVRIPGNGRTGSVIPLVLAIGGRQSNVVTIPIAP